VDILNILCLTAHYMLWFVIPMALYVGVDKHQNLCYNPMPNTISCVYPAQIFLYIVYQKYTICTILYRKVSET